jgi:hypothetical protein
MRTKFTFVLSVAIALGTASVTAAATKHAAPRPHRTGYQSYDYSQPARSPNGYSSSVYCPGGACDPYNHQQVKCIGGACDPQWGLDQP